MSIVVHIVLYHCVYKVLEVYETTIELNKQNYSIRKIYNLW